MSEHALTPDRITALNNLGGGWPENFLFGDFVEGIAPASLTYISKLADFPDPVGGVISLDSSMMYVITADVDISPNVLRPAMGGGMLTIAGIASPISKLRTNNALPLISNNGTGGGFFLWALTLVNTGGECVNYDGGGVGDICQFFVNYQSSVKAGTFANSRLFHAHICEITACAAGFTLAAGTFGNVRLDNMEFTEATGTATYLTVEAGVTLNTFYCQGSLVNIVAGQTAFDIDNAITFATAGGRGSLIANVIDNNGGTPMANLLKSNPRWHIKNNVGILDSRTVGQLGFNGNALQTTGNLNNYEDVAGVFALAAASERFDEPSNGQLRYIGEDAVQVSVRVTGMMETTAGTDNISLQVWLDPDTGVFAGIAESEVGPVEVKAAGINGQTFALETLITLSKDHILKVRARNETDSSNLVAVSMNLTVKE